MAHYLVSLQGSASGVCDSSRGYCECGSGVSTAESDPSGQPEPIWFAGADCNQQIDGQRQYAALEWDGETDPETNITGTVSYLIRAGL